MRSAGGLEIPRRLSRPSLSALLILLIVFFSSGTSFGMSPQQRQLYEKGIHAFDIEVGCSVGGMDGVTVSGESSFLTGDPLTMHFPTITDEEGLATAMDAFMRSRAAGSPWLDIPDVATRLVAEGKLRDVNPMYVVATGLKETGLGRATSGSALDNNSFGNKGDGPHGYRVWSSFEASLFGDDSWLITVSNNLDPDPAVGVSNYDLVTNIYEYISVHLSGQIIYPDSGITSHDSLMNEDIDVTNVVGYFRQVSGWIGEMTGLHIEGVPRAPTPGSTSGVASCGGIGGNGAVNADGYSFPLEDQTKRSYGGTGPPCAYSNGCHGTGSVGGLNEGAAFDLMYGGNGNMDGKDVYAITDGVVLTMHTYRSVPGCFSMNFHSNKDGLNYWYGHLQNAKLELAGQTVTAGTVLAEVAGPQLGPVCHGRSADAQPGSHLHIDRGCPGNLGGGGTCRDPGFVTLMNNLWEQLPPTP